MAKNSICAWQELALGAAILEPGCASQLRTGDWKSMRPVLDEEACIKCGLCYTYCPEFCYTEDEEGFFRANLFYCKGCGICANECPKDAIEMRVEEGDES
ncbi:MAG: 4Fe-4S binding protein [Desulfovibrionaceae bacterium]